MPKGIHLTSSEKDRILAAYKSGLTYREVADSTGYSLNTVGRCVRESGYDRYHVGSSIAKAIPIPAKLPESSQPINPKFVTLSRTIKLHSDVTDFNYTVSTDSDLIDIESDNALMQLKVDVIVDFINELLDIKSMLGKPS